MDYKSCNEIRRKVSNILSDYTGRYEFRIEKSAGRLTSEYTLYILPKDDATCEAVRLVLTTLQQFDIILWYTDHNKNRFLLWPMDHPIAVIID